MARAKYTHPLFYALAAFLRKWDVNQKGLNNKYSNHTKGGNVIESRLSKGLTPKTRERKLRSGVNWQGVLKQNGVKHTGVKRGLGALTKTKCFSLFLFAQLPQVSISQL